VRLQNHSDVEGPEGHRHQRHEGFDQDVAESSTGRILGVHILAENGADLIHEAVLAVKYKLTIDDIIDTVHVFPTMTESTKLVGDLLPEGPRRAQLLRGVKPQRVENVG